MIDRLSISSGKYTTVFSSQFHFPDLYIVVMVYPCYVHYDLPSCCVLLLFVVETINDSLDRKWWGFLGAAIAILAIFRFQHHRIRLRSNDVALFYTLIWIPPRKSSTKLQEHINTCFTVEVLAILPRTSVPIQWRCPFLHADLNSSCKELRIATESESDEVLNLPASDASDPMAWPFSTRFFQP